jgi:hypothetical protein
MQGGDRVVEVSRVAKEREGGDAEGESLPGFEDDTDQLELISAKKK